MMLSVDVVFYRHDEQWAAHCLQLDLVEVASTKRKAMAALRGVVNHHVRWAIEDDDMENLLRPAPPEFWE